MVRYKVTRKGKTHFDFLGDPEFMESDAVREEAERKREVMTVRDWALQQLLAFAQQVENKDYETRARIDHGMTHSRDSLLDGSFPTGDPVTTAHSIQVFDYAQKNLDSLLFEAIAHGFVRKVETKDTLAAAAKKRPLLPLDREEIVLTAEQMCDIEAMYADVPAITDALKEFKRRINFGGFPD